MEVESQGGDATTQKKIDDLPEKKTGSVSYDTYDRVLKGRKRVDSELSDLKAQLADIEQGKAIAEGRKDDVIKSLREENNSIKTNLKEVKKNYAWNSVESQIVNEAVKQGCVNPTKLIRLLDREDLEGIEVSDDFSVNKEDLVRLVEKSKQENSDIGLFGKKTVNVNHAVPKIPNGKSSNELSKEDLINLIKTS